MADTIRPDTHTHGWRPDAYHPKVAWDAVYRTTRGIRTIPTTTVVGGNEATLPAIGY